MILSGNEKLLPGILPGSVCHSVVELRDVMPTLLDFAHAAVPDSVDGKSMLPLTADTTREIRTSLHGEHSYGPLSNHWIATSYDKFIWYTETGTEQYFRTEEDPHELHNQILNPAYQERIFTLRSQLIHELKNRPEGFSDGTHLLKGMPYPPYLGE